VYHFGYWSSINQRAKRFLLCVLGVFSDIKNNNNNVK